MTVIPSAPAEFAFPYPPGGGAQAVTFAVPAGAWTAGIWTLAYTVEGGPRTGAYAVAAGDTSSFGATPAGAGNWTAALPLDAAQLAAANAAGGGSLAATLALGGLAAIGDGYTGDAVTAFTLTLSDCGYGVAPTSAAYSAAGGSGAIAVTAADGCPWAAAANADWIAITAGATGAGNGTVQYTVAPQPATGGWPRSASITVAGETVAITQAGLPVASAVVRARHDPGGCGAYVSVAVTFPFGYAPQSALPAGAPSAVFTSVRPRGPWLGTVPGGALRLADLAGAELAPSTPCDGADVLLWRTAPNVLDR